MPLRRKIFLILALVITAYAVLDQLTQRAIVMPSFERLEEDEAREDVLRVANAIRREVDALEFRARELGRWDATYTFLEERSEDYVRSNLDPAALREAGLNLVFFCAPDGEVVWSRIRDGDTDAELSLRDFPRGAIARGHVLLALGDGENEPPSRRGIMTLLDGGRPMITASHRVLRSNGAGPSRGTVILGRFLDSREIVEDLVDQTRVTFDLWDGTSLELPEREQAVLTAVTTQDEPVTLAGDDGKLYAYTSVADIRDNHSLLLRANTERRISAQGRSALRYSFLSTLAAGLILLFVLIVLLQRTVVAPLLRLARHAVEVGRTDDTLSRLALDRDDEIGTLSREFDAMLGKLHTSREQVVTAARAAGMSEIATGVLHNVGNVLNSVNVSAEMVARKMRESAVDDLARVVEVLDQNEAELGRFISEDPKGKHLHPFLRSLSSKLTSNRQVLAEEMRNLTSGIDHIKVLVRAQQSYAKSSEVKEATDVAQLLEAALEMSYQVLPREDDLIVHRSFDEPPHLLLDRHKLMEILVNLVINARQAMSQAGVRPPTLRLAVRVTGANVGIEIGDNGVGISQENLVKIFTHGFTTKTEGHGFGLHTAANAATELHGSLDASSAGAGQGATFTLTLPLPETAHPQSSDRTTTAVSAVSALPHSNAGDLAESTGSAPAPTALPSEANR